MNGPASQRLEARSAIKEYPLNRPILRLIVPESAHPISQPFLWQESAPPGQVRVVGLALPARDEAFLRTGNGWLRNSRSVA
jgi:hypothetical protein